MSLFAECFIDRLRDEYLNKTLFASLADVKDVLAERCDGDGTDTLTRLSRLGFSV